MAGPTTSASAASTTCSAPAKTSTSSCSTPRSYSNTGGQMSKATPRGAVAKFAAGGKPQQERSRHGSRQLRLVYVARSRWAAAIPRHQGLPGSRSLRRSVLIIAYSHASPTATTSPRPRAAEESCALRLLAADALQPALRAEGKNPFQLDSRPLHPAQGLQLQRSPLHHARAQPSGTSPPSCSRSAGRRRTPVARLLGARSMPGRAILPTSLQRKRLRSN
jgi:hypothetical protein